MSSQLLWNCTRPAFALDGRQQTGVSAGVQNSHTVKQFVRATCVVCLQWLLNVIIITLEEYHRVRCFQDELQADLACTRARVIEGGALAHVGAGSVVSHAHSICMHPPQVSLPLTDTCPRQHPCLLTCIPWSSIHHQKSGSIGQ